MPTFINIQIEDKNCWMLRISNYDDVIDYIRFFTGRAWAGAKMCVERIETLKEISHLGGDPEATILKVMAECEADEKGHYKFKPLEHTGKLISMKLKLLMDMVGNKTEVIINENGGCCDLPSFLQIHKASVVKEITSDEMVFPKEVDKNTTYKLIILENDNEIDYDYKQITHLTYSNDSKLINKLKTKGKEQIFFYLENCEEVITKTTFLNKDQTLNFLKLFSHLKNKTIKIISGNISNFMDELKISEQMKELYTLVLSRNKVIFYNPLLEIIEAK